MYYQLYLMMCTPSSHLGQEELVLCGWPKGKNKKLFFSIFFFGRAAGGDAEVRALASSSLLPGVATSYLILDNLCFLIIHLHQFC